MNKKRWLALVMVMLLIGALLAACAPKPAPAPAPAPKPAPAPAPLPKIVWNVISHQVKHEVLPMPQGAAFAKRVEERTGGGFKIQVAIEGELGLKRDAFNEALAAGTLELCMLSSPVAERVLPFVGIHHLPQIAVDAEGWIKVWKALADFDQAEMKRVGYELLHPGAYYIEWNQEMFAKDPLDLTNLKGVKVRVWQVTMEKVIAALGGEPVYMPFTDVYMAMQRGVVRAFLTGPPAAVGASAWEMASQFYPVGHPGGMEWLVVSTKAFKTLPEEYRKILIEEAPKWGEDCRKGVAGEVENALARLKEKGMKMNELNPAERKAWREAATALWNEWAAAEPRNAKALEMAKKAVGL